MRKQSIKYFMNCVNEEESVTFNCIANDKRTSVCYCSKKNHIHPSRFRMRNTDLYSNLNIADVSNVTLTENWEKGLPERINDCFDLNNGFYWTCSTVENNITHAHCRCYSLNGNINDTSGFIDTKTLFKGLENFFMPLQHGKNAIASLDQIRHDENFPTYEKKKNFLEETSAFYIIFLFFLIILSLFLVFVYYNCKYTSSCKFRKPKDISDLVLLFSSIEE